MEKTKAWLFLLIGFCTACQVKETAPAAEAFIAEAEEDMEEAGAVKIGRTGKLLNGERMDAVYQKAPLEYLEFPVIHSDLVQALDNQLELLRLTNQKKNHRIGNLTIQTDELKKTVEILRSRQQMLPVDLHHYLEAYQIWGQDRKGNVRITGYYTPVIPVRKTPNQTFRYPIYSRPKNWEGALPTREEIDGKGALKGLGLELCYAESRSDIYYMQLQGSGYVEFPDGQQELLSYNGTNRHPYRSIEKYLLSRKDIDLPILTPSGIKAFLKDNPELADTVLYHNPSYTFFKPRNTPPKGAGQVLLTPDISVAVDSRYIPLGSCLLASFPVYDFRKKRVIRHEYRLLMAQDVGGAIRGPGHIDFYTGIGRSAQKNAASMSHYGQIWLLLPKKSQDAVSMN